MNIKKWKDSPGIQGTKEKLETRLEDQKLRGILTWIFEIASGSGVCWPGWESLCFSQ